MTTTRVALVANDLGPVPDWVLAELVDGQIELIDRPCESPDQVAQVAASAEVVWVMGGSKVIAARVLPELARCRTILRTGSGTDNIPVAEATRCGIAVANTPEAIAPAVAEHAIGLLLAVVRQIAVHDRLIRQNIWDRRRAFPSFGLAGRTLGLVGFGRIARLVAVKSRGFELRIIAYDPVVDVESFGLDVAAVGLDELLAQSDFISIHVPLSDATRHLIGEAQFGRMKPGAVLINTSRGPVVDQAALVRALQTGRLSGAGLDVLEVEPPPADCPLLTMDNVVLTPHIASGSDQFVELFWSHSVRTLRAIAQTGRPLWCVNPEVWG